MNIVTYVSIGIVILVLLLTGVTMLVENKKRAKEFIVIDKYVVTTGTPIYFRSFRHIELYVGRMKQYKSVNLYLSQDGRFVETVANPLFEKELTSLDKDVLVIRLEDRDGFRQLISYELKELSGDKLNFLESLEINDKVMSKMMIESLKKGPDVDLDVLVNEKSNL